MHYLPLILYIFQIKHAQISQNDSKTNAQASPLWLAISRFLWPAPRLPHFEGSKKHHLHRHHLHLHPADNCLRIRHFRPTVTLHKNLTFDLHLTKPLDGLLSTETLLIKPFPLMINNYTFAVSVVDLNLVQLPINPSIFSIKAKQCYRERIQDQLTG